MLCILELVLRTTNIEEKWKENEEPNRSLGQTKKDEKKKFFFFPVLGIEPRTLHMLCHPATSPCSEV
jgi:hypothetical protein